MKASSELGAKLASVWPLLAAQLSRQKHPVSHRKVAQLLHDQGYSLQGNRKTKEGGDHPDRDAQFRHINTRVKRALAKGAPVISVDTKKKELVGDYENGGQQWLPAKKPVKVQGHDFPHPDIPRRTPTASTTWSATRAS